MPKISKARQDARRLQILEAARRCFYRRGLHETTMANIIRASGLSAGGVYLYFKNKDEIILTAVVRSLEGVRNILIEIVERNDFSSVGQLVTQVALGIDHFSIRHGYDLRSLALLGWSEAQTNAEVRRAMRPPYQKFLSILAAAIERGRQRGAINSMASSKETASVILSLLLGNVVQGALLENNASRKLSVGIRGLASGSPQAKRRTRMRKVT